MRPKIVDSVELARILKVKRRTVLTWARLGLIPCIKASRTYRFEVPAVLDALRARDEAAAP